MLERRSETNFARESFRAQSSRDLTAQNLDDNFALECRFVREEDARHPAAAKLALYGVRVSEDCLKTLATVQEAGSSVIRTSREGTPPARGGQ